MRSSSEKDPSSSSSTAAAAALANRVIEEAKGILKSGIVQAAFAPVKSSKQRKEYYAVLSERALELHDLDKYNKMSSSSGAGGKKGKPVPPRHLVDLSVAFNVHNDHFDHKFGECVCLMGPDETLLIKASSAVENTQWYEAIMSAVVPSRALRLGRPVLLSEFFEFAWDVDIVAGPSRLKKPLPPEDRMPSMVDKLPGLGTGPRRLCFYPHTIVICKRKIEPALSGLPPSGIPPFKQDQFIEIPRMFAPFFGCLEKYFLVRMGRGSPAGSCELWVQTDSEEVANVIHRKLTMIIERETEKRKKMNGGIATSTLPSLRSHHHRERSHTQPMHMRTNSNGHIEPGLVPSSGGPGPVPSFSPSIDSDDVISPSIVVPTPSPYVSARDRRSMLRDCKALIDSFEEETNRPVQQVQSGRGLAVASVAGGSLRPRGSLGSPASLQMELLGRLDRPRGSVHSLGTPAMQGADRRICSPAQSTSMIGRKPSASGPSGSLSSRCASLSTPHGGSPQSRSGHHNNSLTWSVFPSQPVSGRRSSNTASIKEEPSAVYQEMTTPTVAPSTNKTATSQKGPFDNAAGLADINGSVCSSGTVNTEETEDSGGTLRLDSSSCRDGRTGSTRSSQRSLIIAEAVIERRSKDISSSDNEGSVGGVSGLSATASSTSADTRDPGDEREQEEMEDSYAPMDAADWNYGSNSHLIVPNQYDRDRYNLEEVRSYASDSDSCYSSMANAVGVAVGGAGGRHHHPANPQNPLRPVPRAYSFGGQSAHTMKPSSITATSAASGGGESSASSTAECECHLLQQQQLAHQIPGQSHQQSSHPRLSHLPHHHHHHHHHHLMADGRGGVGGDNAAGLVPPFDDYFRQRAFSLGNRTYIPPDGRPIRKSSAHGRQQRHSQTSTSGISLASSTDRTDPLSAVSSNHISCSPLMDKDAEYPRKRSGSFGSGRSTPYTRRCGGGASSVASGGGGPMGNDHHVEMDFSVLGRTGSGSLASVESPSRSRTSSFGCGVRKEDMFAPYPLDLDGSHLIGQSGLSVGGASGDMLTPSQKLLQQTRQTSIDDCGEYVLTETPEAIAKLAISEQMQQQQNAYMSPTEQFKAMDLRQLQLIETIQENASEKSSRSSSAASLAHPADDDEYTMMECPPSSSSPLTISPSMDKSLSLAPSNVDSPSTRPDRSASSPVRDSLIAPLGLPKRSSVPSMHSHHETTKDDSTLNYACLQIQDDSFKTAGSVPDDCLLSASTSSARTRSKSGILYSPTRAPDHAPSSPSPSHSPQNNVDYTVVRPL